MHASVNTLRSASAPRLRHWAAGFILPILCLYFAFYLVFGPRGLLAWQRAEARLETAHAVYSDLKIKREKLTGDVTLMRPTSLDPDMAEEQARKILGYTRPEDIIIDLE